MSDVSPSETCDCPRDHYRSADGRCRNPSLRSESESLTGYSECGCCVADCPDVHAETGDGLRAVPGSLVVAAEYVASLDLEQQRKLREQEQLGELMILPRGEMMPGQEVIVHAPHTAACRYPPRSCAA